MRLLRGFKTTGDLYASSKIYLVEFANPTTKTTQTYALFWGKRAWVNWAAEGGRPPIDLKRGWRKLPVEFTPDSDANDRAFLVLTGALALRQIHYVGDDPETVRAFVGDRTPLGVLHVQGYPGPSGGLPAPS